MTRTAVPIDRSTKAGGGFLARMGRAMTIALLRSPLGRPLGGSMTVVGYQGRMSGRRLATPVEYVRDGSTVTIVVAHPERKQWWRNVVASPEVSLLLDGRERPGTARVMAPPEADAQLAAYVAARPRAGQAIRSGALAVVVHLLDVAP